MTRLINCDSSTIKHIDSSSVSRQGMESIRSGGREKINHENCRAWLTSVLPKHSTQDFQKDKEKTEEQLFNDLKDGKLLCRLLQFFTKEEIAIKNRLVPWDTLLREGSFIICLNVSAPTMSQALRSTTSISSSQIYQNWKSPGSTTNYSERRERLCSETMLTFLTSWMGLPSCQGSWRRSLMSGDLTATRRRWGRRESKEIRTI